MNIYISSIDNGTGKTVISAGLAAVMQSLDYTAGVYKPVQTSAIDKGSFLVSPDLAFVKMLDSHITVHSTYMFKTKTSPLFASKKENTTIELQKIINDYLILKNKLNTVLVEAPGGLMTPLADGLFAYHIPLELNLPVAFIVTPSLNSINHYFNEINTAKTAGLNIAGVIINNYPIASTVDEIIDFPLTIENYCNVKVLGLIRSFKGTSVQSNILFNEILNGIDLEDLFEMKIPKLNLP